MAKPAARLLFLQATLGTVAVLLLGRAFQVQVLQHRVWSNRLAQSREHQATVPARRGRIFDRKGRILALSEEQYHVSISLNEVTDTAGLRARLVQRLHIPAARVAAQFENDYPWFNGPFTADQLAPIRDFRGVHATKLYNRVYPLTGVATALLGHLDETGAHGVDGLERALDSLLAGKPGAQQVLIDGRGRPLPIPGPPLRAPEAGKDVYLTIDADLQSLAESMLHNTVVSTQGHGGDVVVIDVRSGEILALASLTQDSATHNLIPTLAAIAAPNQPGSTSKLFTIAALLRYGRDTSPVQGYGGRWTMQIGRTSRTIEDEHKLDGPVTLAETVKYSSNIAISQFAERLAPNEQFETIRDFGFGTAQALGIPGESNGVLIHPARWQNADYSRPSLGMGYEWEATSAQLATAYAAIANHGLLMAPSVLRETRDADGKLIWRHLPDTVRRAIPDSIAQRLLAYLRLATDSGGTGSRAQLDRIPVVGKTGTARVTTNGHEYRASFAGLFPGNNPSTVVYVMIDRPAGKYFGGEVAAPAVRQYLQEGLAIPDTPLDRSWLAATVPLPPAPPTRDSDSAVGRPVMVPVPVTQLPNEPLYAPVPDVRGFDLRHAVLAMHQAGLQVRVDGRSRVRATHPAAGDSLTRGQVVTLIADSTP